MHLAHSIQDITLKDVACHGHLGSLHSLDVRLFGPLNSQFKKSLVSYQRIEKLKCLMINIINLKDTEMKNYLES